VHEGGDDRSSKILVGTDTSASADLAKELGLSEDLLEALPIEGGLPCARELATGRWWLSDEGQLRAWREYLEPPKPTEAFRSSYLLV
jgi:hypothetical protein